VVFEGRIGRRAGFSLVTDALHFVFEDSQHAQTGPCPFGQVVQHDFLAPDLDLGMALVGEAWESEQILQIRFVLRKGRWVALQVSTDHFQQ